jgi:hypothetical protein
MASIEFILEPNEQKEIFTLRKSVNIENNTDETIRIEVLNYDLRVHIKVKENAKSI